MGYGGIPRSGPELEALTEEAEIDHDRDRAKLRQEVEAMEAHPDPAVDELRPDPLRRLIRTVLRPFRSAVRR